MQLSKALILLLVKAYNSRIRGGGAKPSSRRRVAYGCYVTINGRIYEWVH